MLARISTFTALLLVLSACAPRLTPTPQFIRDGIIDPFEKMSEGEKRTEVEIFYATSRKPLEPGKKGARYGNGRSPSVKLGVSTVRIGKPKATWEEVLDSSRRGGRPRIAIEKVEEYGTLPATAFPENPTVEDRTHAESPRDHPVWIDATRWAEAINDQMERGGMRTVHVYVHGATAAFKTPIEQLTSFSHYMGRQGAYVAYCWPVGSTAFGYFRAGDRARASTRALRELITFLAEETEAERINIIAYSAGGVIVTGALHQLRLIHDEVPAAELADVTKVQTVILTGSDEDVPTTWQYWMDGADVAARQVTVYVSALDLTMGFAVVANVGRETVGSLAIKQRPAEAQGIDTSGVSRTEVVDVTRAQWAAGFGNWGHSYWKDNPLISTDVILQLHSGLSPSERGLVHPDKPEDATWWVFPRDYKKRLKEGALEHVRQTEGGGSISTDNEPDADFSDLDGDEGATEAPEVAASQT
jgi:esterase/lipase superfamily enzyme